MGAAHVGFLNSWESFCTESFQSSEFKNGAAEECHRIWRFIRLCTFLVEGRGSRCMDIKKESGGLLYRWVRSGGFPKGNYKISLRMFLAFYGHSLTHVRNWLINAQPPPPIVPYATKQQAGVETCHPLPELDLIRFGRATNLFEPTHSENETRSLLYFERYGGGGGGGFFARPTSKFRTT